MVGEVRSVQPSSVPEVLVLVADSGVGDPGNTVLPLPVVPQLTEPVEVTVRGHLYGEDMYQGMNITYIRIYTVEPL